MHIVEAKGIPFIEMLPIGVRVISFRFDWFK